MESPETTMTHLDGEPRSCRGFLSNVYSRLEFAIVRAHTLEWGLPVQPSFYGRTASWYNESQRIDLSGG